MRKVIELLKLTLPFNGLIAFFNHDAHGIVSEKGWRVLNNRINKK